MKILSTKRFKGCEPFAQKTGSDRTAVWQTHGASPGREHRKPHSLAMPLRLRTGNGGPEKESPQFYLRPAGAHFNCYVIRPRIPAGEVGIYVQTKARLYDFEGGDLCHYPQPPGAKPDAKCADGGGMIPERGAWQTIGNDGTAKLRD